MRFIKGEKKGAEVEGELSLRPGRGKGRGTSVYKLLATVSRHLHDQGLLQFRSLFLPQR